MQRLVQDEITAMVERFAGKLRRKPEIGGAGRWPAAAADLTRRGPLSGLNDHAGSRYGGAS
jgi:hypothetical protein